MSEIPEPPDPRDVAFNARFDQEKAEIRDTDPDFFLQLSKVGNAWLQLSPQERANTTVSEFARNTMGIELNPVLEKQAIACIKLMAKMQQGEGPDDPDDPTTEADWWKNPPSQ